MKWQTIGKIICFNSLLLFLIGYGIKEVYEFFKKMLIKGGYNEPSA